MSFKEKHLELKENGYTVIDVKWLNAAATRSEFRSTLKTFPEFKSNPDSYILGGFSALCNPASFHNPFVRKMRQYAMYELMPVFQEVTSALPGNKWKLEQVVDRMLFRPSGTSATAESWHRDEAVLANQGDKVFGGWWNFDDENQYFSCIPGSHKDVQGNSGFNTIKNKKTIAHLKTIKKRVAIPSGSILLFQENILHEVLAKKVKHDMYRLFLGWRITKTNKPLYIVDEYLKTNAVMPLKSNQIPSMYALLHWTNWRKKITDFTDKNIKDVCTENRRVISKTSKSYGEVYRVVHRYMRSLDEYGFKKYRKYSKHEIRMHKPHTSWYLKNGKSDRYVKVRLIKKSNKAKKKKINVNVGRDLFRKQHLNEQHLRFIKEQKAKKKKIDMNAGRDLFRKQHLKEQHLRFVNEQKAKKTKNQKLLK